MRRFLLLLTFFTVTSVTAMPTEHLVQPGSTPRTTDELVWVKTLDNKLPAHAVVAADNGGKKLYICQAVSHAGIHPGVVSQGGCTITYGGKAEIHKNYQVLTGQAQITWQPGNLLYQTAYRYSQPMTGIIPQGMSFAYLRKSPAPVVTGYEYPPVNPAETIHIALPQTNLRLLYSCRVMYGDGVYVGKAVNAAGCNIAVNGKEITVQSPQILFLKAAQSDWEQGVPQAPVL